MAESFAAPQAQPEVMSAETRQYLELRKNPELAAQQEVVAEYGWRELAACKSWDVNAFYQGDGESGLTWDRRKEFARQICQKCVVVNDCLEWALQHGERQGMWGGVDMHEMRKKR